VRRKTLGKLQYGDQTGEKPQKGRGETTIPVALGTRGFQVRPAQVRRRRPRSMGKKGGLERPRKKMPARRKKREKKSQQPDGGYGLPQHRKWAEGGRSKLVIRDNNTTGRNIDKKKKAGLGKKKKRQMEGGINLKDKEKGQPARRPRDNRTTRGGLKPLNFLITTQRLGGLQKQRRQKRRGPRRSSNVMSSGV